MKTVKLGDLEVGAISYGCWRFAEGGMDLAPARTKIETALQCGMSLIDTADIYGFGTEAGFGGAEVLLGNLFAEDSDLRGRMVLATKGGIIPPRPYDSSYDYLMRAVEASLARLRVACVDLYQIHRPDLLVSARETARALNRMVADGLTKHIGVSNYTVSQTRALQAHLDVPLVSVQPEFSAAHQDPVTDGTLDWCEETGAVALAWSPLGGGALLSGDGEIATVIDRIADTHSATRAMIALAFTMGFGADVIPIIGTQTPDRIRECARAAKIDLSAREVYDIVEAHRGEAMP